MGSLRFILALAVLLGHLGYAHAMTGASTSVQSFYVVSGFFIAMILDTKYIRLSQTGLFYSNRFLRIYSVYWLFVILTIGLEVGVELWTHRTGMTYFYASGLRRIGWGGAAFLGVSNLGIFGQDWTLFLKIGQHGLSPTANFWTAGQPMVNQFLLIPQAWSLGLELSFYLIAPWILRWKTWFLAALLASTVCLRAVLWHFGLREDPWSYRFFPVELGTFLVGALSYRLIYRRIKDRPLRLWLKLVGLGIFPAVAFYPFYDHSYGLFFPKRHLVFFLYFAVAVPILFRLTQRSRIDRQLGELSYPLYLGHLLAIRIVDEFSLGLGGSAGRATVAIIIASVLAYLSAILFDAPINRFRQRRIERSQKLHEQADRSGGGHFNLRA